MKRKISLKEIHIAFFKEGISMRRRFSFSLITCLIAMIAVFMLFLSLFGVLNPAGGKLEHSLTQQLDFSFNRIHRNMDQLAACTVEFSQEMTAQISAIDLPFTKLRNNPEALTDLQHSTYATVFNYLRLADCSGAFFVLNTTVNDSLEDIYYSGIYLKYVNVGSDTTFQNSVCMFRGNSQVARQNNINLSSAWEYETKKTPSHKWKKC